VSLGVYWFVVVTNLLSSLWNMHDGKRKADRRLLTVGAVVLALSICCVYAGAVVHARDESHVPAWLSWVAASLGMVLLWGSWPGTRRQWREIRERQRQQQGEARHRDDER